MFSLYEKRGMVIQGVFLFAFGPYLAGLSRHSTCHNLAREPRAHFDAQSIVFLTFTHIFHMRFAFLKFKFHLELAIEQRAWAVEKKLNHEQFFMI